LFAGETEWAFQVADNWRRYSVVGTGLQPPCRAGLAVPAGVSLQLREPQLEAQPTPGAYKPSRGLNGIHTRARFEGSSLTIRSTGPGVFSAEVTIWSPEVR
jgi:hypothetical protein